MRAACSLCLQRRVRASRPQQPEEGMEGWVGRGSSGVGVGLHGVRMVAGGPDNPSRVSCVWLFGTKPTLGIGQDVRCLALSASHNWPCRRNSSHRLLQCWLFVIQSSFLHALMFAVVLRLLSTLYRSGCRQWVNYFLHSGHLEIEGLKMSKSLKNFITIR